MKNKVYIGDSVYAEVNPGFLGGGELVLTTENGYPDDPRNRIVLGPSEWDNLVRFIEAHQQKPNDVTDQKEHDHGIPL